MRSCFPVQGALDAAQRRVSELESAPELLAPKEGYEYGNRKGGVGIQIFGSELCEFLMIFLFDP